MTPAAPSGAPPAPSAFRIAARALLAAPIAETLLTLLLVGPGTLEREAAEAALRAGPGGDEALGLLHALAGLVAEREGSFAGASRAYEQACALAPPGQRRLPVGAEPAPPARPGRRTPLSAAPELDPGPTWFRIALRSLFAGPAAELLVCLVMAFVWERQDRDHGLPLEALIPALGFGLGLGAAFAVAEGLARHTRPAFGLLAGLALAPLAPLGGLFAFHLGSGSGSAAATADALAGSRALWPDGLAELLAGAALLYGPLLWVAERRPLRRARALLVGGVVWIGALVLAGRTDPCRLPADMALLCVLLRGPAFVGALVYGDHLARRAEEQLVAGVVTTEIAPRWTLGKLVVLGVGVVVALTLVVRPEPCHVTVLRLRALDRDPAALLAAGDALLAGPARPVADLWPPGPELAMAAPRSASAAWDGYSRRRRIEPAVGLITEAAEAGHVPAMLRLADLLREEVRTARGGEQPAQVEKARRCVGWLRRAAAAGSPEGMARLGNLLCWGWPGVISLQEGRAWLERAAGLGHHEAARDLDALDAAIRDSTR